MQTNSHSEAENCHEKTAIKHWQRCTFYSAVFGVIAFWNFSSEIYFLMSNLKYKIYDPLAHRLAAGKGVGVCLEARRLGCACVLPFRRCYLNRATRKYKDKAVLHRCCPGLAA